MSSLCDDAKNGHRCGDDCCSSGVTLCGWDGEPELLDDDPPCECVRVDVDEDDSSGCPLHGPHGPLARRDREREAQAESVAAARIPFLLGEDWSNA
jgi:hypothetical protein